MISKYIYRKEISMLLEVSIDTVERNEKRWGLHKHRADLNVRMVRYHRAAVFKILRARKMLEI